MTRTEFVTEFQSEIDGWLLDACMSGRSGAELSLWLRQKRAKIQLKLGEMFDALCVTESTKTLPARRPA